MECDPFCCCRAVHGRWETLLLWPKLVCVGCLPILAIAHAGYLLLGITNNHGEVIAHLPFSRPSPTTDAVLFYILTYGLTTIGAFGVVSVVERATGSDRLALSSACTSAIRCWPRCCSSSFSHSQEFPAGRLLCQVQPLCRGPRRLGRAGSIHPCSFGGSIQRRIALLLSAGAQAGLCHARCR